MKLTAQKEKATGQKGPATALELGTYALSRSFIHASHGDQSRSSVPHRPYVPVIGVTLCCNHLQPAPRGWYCVRCDGSRLSGT